MSLTWALLPSILLIGLGNIGTGHEGTLLVKAVEVYRVVYAGDEMAITTKSMHIAIRGVPRVCYCRMQGPFSMHNHHSLMHAGIC